MIETKNPDAPYNRFPCPESGAHQFFRHEPVPIFTKVRRYSLRRRSYDCPNNKVTNSLNGIYKATRRQTRKIRTLKSTISAYACSSFSFI